jgi:hypothetical protein
MSLVVHVPYLFKSVLPVIIVSAGRACRDWLNWRGHRLEAFEFEPCSISISYSGFLVASSAIDNKVVGVASFCSCKISALLFPHIPEQSRQHYVTREHDHIFNSVQPSYLGRSRWVTWNISLLKKDAWWVRHTESSWPTVFIKISYQAKRVEW